MGQLLCVFAVADDALGSRWCNFGIQLIEAMTFLISQGKKAVRTSNLAARYKTARVVNKLVQFGMGRNLARFYSNEFTKLPERLKVVKS